MVRDVREVDGDHLTADVCVLGSGAAGLTLAHELDRTAMRVVVLEGGGRRIEPRSQRLYKAEVVGLEHRGVHDLRYRVFGGTTTRWAGQALPLADIDFETRDWVPDSGWPLTRDQLDPYYARASEVMGIHRFPRHAGDDWPDVLPAPPAFDPRLLMPFYSQFSAEPNFAQSHGAVLAGSEAVDILLGANVTELVPDRARTYVQGARVRSFDGRQLEVQADAFVLCCGGIESPRILLASNRYAEEGLGNEHDLVGRFFQDHPGFAVGPVTGGRSIGASHTFAPRRRGGIKFVARFGAGEQLQQEERLLNAAGGIVFEGAQSESINAGKLIYRALRASELRPEARGALGAVARDPWPLVRAGVRYMRGRPALDTSGTPVLGVGCEQVPNPSSRVRLGESRDELGIPRAVLDWRLTESEISTCRRFAEVAAIELERTGVGRVDLEAFALPDDPDELSGHVIDAGHHMGTLRMATDPSRGVVDLDCKVFGLDNLYVGSSAVFPTSGCSNPTFTIIALCLRIADTLKQRLASTTALEERL
jgi:choline dehydrogenase-like flavoprotein